MAHQGWNGVDLDGTLAHYDGWKGVEHIGHPIQPMVDRVLAWRDQKKEVRIFTARVWPLSVVWPEATEEELMARAGQDPIRQAATKSALRIREWCEKHLGEVLPITCTKDYSMVQLWDDRAVQVVPNTGIRADGLS